MRVAGFEDDQLARAEAFDMGLCGSACADMHVDLAVEHQEQFGALIHVPAIGRRNPAQLYSGAIEAGEAGAGPVGGAGEGAGVEALHIVSWGMSWRVSLDRRAGIDKQCVGSGGTLPRRRGRE